MPKYHVCLSRKHLTTTSIVVTNNTAEKFDGDTYLESEVLYLRMYGVYYCGLIPKQESPYVLLVSELISLFILTLILGPFLWSTSVLAVGRVA
jgi:hypothetical protein